MEMNYSGYDITKIIFTGETIIEDVVSDLDVGTIVRKGQSVYTTGQGKPYLH